MIFPILTMAVDAIRANTLRSLFTGLGVCIGTALVMIVLNVGSAFEALILEQIASIQPETLYIEVQAPDSKDENGAVEVRTMTLKDVEALRKLPYVARAHGVVYHQSKVQYEQKSFVRMMMGVGASYAPMNVLPMSHGRFFTEAHEKSRAQVVVLGHDIAKDLFGSKNPVGERVRLAGKAYEVQGVVDAIGSKFFLNMDETVYIPTSTLIEKILGQDHILAISLEVEDASGIPKVIPLIEKTLRRLHKIQDPKKDDFVVRTMDQAMNIVGSITTGVSILLFGVAGISLLVGGVGIMNIMYVTVAERTGEIGLKKAIGASPFAIRFQFLAEAWILTVLGAFLGIMIGIAFSYFVSIVAHFFGFTWVFSIQISSVLVALLSSTCIALLFGYAPANRAAKLSPILALRRS